jgi:heme A synthase
MSSTWSTVHLTEDPWSCSRWRQCRYLQLRRAQASPRPAYVVLSSSTDYQAFCTTVLNYLALFPRRFETI